MTRSTPDRVAFRRHDVAALERLVASVLAEPGAWINVEPDLSHYDGIVPCGIAGHGVTSLVDLGLPVTMADLDVALAETFEEVFQRERESIAV